MMQITRAKHTCFELCNLCNSARAVWGFVEQWPKQPKETGRADRLDEEDFPRNFPVHRLKDALQKSLAEAESHQVQKSAKSS